MGRSSQPTGWRKLFVSEDGFVSIEFALWIPVMVFILMLVADTSAMLFAQANMWQVAGDLSRAVATGRMSMHEAQQLVAANTPFSIQITPQGELLTMELTRPFSDIGTGTVLSLIGDMRVQVFQHLEPGVQL